MKIDAWTHILTPAYVRHLEKAESNASGTSSFLLANRALHDLQYRFKVMDAYEDYRQVLMPIPGPHIYVQRGSRDKTLADLVRRNNDEMAETIKRYPGRFVGFAAATPISDPDAATAEAVRAVRQLGALGVQLEEDAGEFPLHHGHYDPLFAAMEDLEAAICYLAASLSHARVAGLSEGGGAFPSMAGLWVGVRHHSHNLAPDLRRHIGSAPLLEIDCAPWRGYDPPLLGARRDDTIFHEVGPDAASGSRPSPQNRSNISKCFTPTRPCSAPAWRTIYPGVFRRRPSAFRNRCALRRRGRRSIYSCHDPRC